MSMERVHGIDPAVDGQIQEVVAQIDGQAVVDDLLELAAIGGEHRDPTDDHPLHIATNRPALTEADLAGREFIRQRMDAIGMKVNDDHPLAVIGMYPGLYEDLDPVVAMSHTDTVPSGDIYDGTLGVLGALKAVEVMRGHGIHPERDTYVVSLSIEESSRFGSALRGSRALFHGLTAEELDMRKPGDQSIRGALGEAAAARAGVPEFGPKGRMLPTPYAVVELHVEQGRRLIDQYVDLGVVHSIASPVRYRATVGEWPLSPDNWSHESERYFRLTVHGRPDHSGATPMGRHDRADGLLETVHILEELLEGQDYNAEPTLDVGSIEVADAAMNKVPGETVTMLRIVGNPIGNSMRAAKATYARLQAVLVEHRSTSHAETATRLSALPFDLEEIGKAEAGDFFGSPDIVMRQRAAFSLIKSVNKAALGYASDNVVGTVASLTTSSEGVISMEVDIRGIESDSRNLAVQQVQRDIRADRITRLAGLALGEPLPGSGDAPVTLDSRLVSTALDTIDRFGIGSAASMFSAAGHDTQNAARAGIPSVMIFCQSKDGISHNPDAYTSPANIGKGVRAQAALMLRLANEVPEF